MTIAFHSIALIGKYQNPEIRDQLITLAQFLGSKGIKIHVEQRTAIACGVSGYSVLPIEQLGQHVQLAVVLGGDGTMLTVARALVDFKIPLVGVNRGSFGFLTDISSDAMLEGLERILCGEFKIEPRLMLGAKIVRNGEVVSEGRAFNDVVVSKGDLARLIELELAIDGDYAHRQRSDGLIVATPTGSTAYALSAGGPVLHPALQAITLVPVCPHTLTSRPLAIASSSTVDIRVVRADDARVHFDGQLHAELQQNDTVMIRRLENSVKLLHPIGYNHYTMLREKLHWG